MAALPQSPLTGLTFEPETHTYRLNGARIISVTQALGRAGLIDTEWYTEFSRQRGKAVHLATQLDDEGELDESTVSPVIRPYLEASRKFKADTGFKPELIEARACMIQCGYAGTLDRVGIWGSDQNRLIDKKQRILLDYKTGAIQDWAALQLAAYAHALPNGATYTRYAVQLKPDGTYRIHRFDVKDFRSHLNDFLACVRVAQIKERYGPAV